MNVKKSRDVLDDALRTHLRGDVNLLPQIATQFAKGNATMKTRTRFIFGTILALIVFTLALFMFPGVALAFQSLFRYIPGLGVVDASVAIRKLTKPASQTREGITVMVDRVTISETITSIHLKITGIPASAYPLADPSNSKDLDAFCGAQLYLRYPDGTTSKIDGFNGGSYGSRDHPDYEFDWTVTPVPARFDTAWLILPCLMNTDKRLIPENWELPLYFVPMTTRELVPVTNISTMLPTKPSKIGPTPTYTATVSAQLEPRSSEITLVLDKVVHLPDGDMFYSRLKWAENAPFSVTDAHTMPTFSEERSFKLTDSNNQLIPETDVLIDSSAWKPSMLGSSVLPLQFKTDMPIQTSGPVTLTIDHITVSMSTLGSDGIVFDTGSDPQVGQQWPIHRDFHVLGRNIEMLSATRVADGYDFSFQSDSTDIQSISVFMPDSAPQYTSEQSHQGNIFHQHVMFMSGDVVYGPIPSGEIKIRSIEITSELFGPWQVTWQP